MIRVLFVCWGNIRRNFENLMISVLARMFGSEFRPDLDHLKEELLIRF